jgi:transcription antitermination factor NusG
MEQWYTLYTKPNSEYQVANTLERQGIHTYLPELESPKTQHKSGRKPFFPCYLFTRIDFTKVGLSRLQWTPGLRRVVAFDDQPVPLPDEVINLIRRKLGELNAAGGSSGHISVNDLEKAQRDSEAPTPKRRRGTRGKGRRIKPVSSGLVTKHYR